MGRLFTSESVSEGHPDKVADQISDALIDNYLAFDSESKVACETMVTTGQVMLAGETKSTAILDVQKIAREAINKIGYNKADYMFDGNSCGVLSAIHEQSADINQGVDKQEKEDQGAGDQGMMFGYATNETENYMPAPLNIAHAILKELEDIRKHESELVPYLRPDAKSQVTMEYDENDQPIRIDSIVVSTQHDAFENSDEAMLKKIKHDIIHTVIPRVKNNMSSEIQKLFNDNITYHVNPTGKFVIGGPHGDTGLTGRKIIVDTYGGKGAHGGGAFSGKDPSKVDRSAAYATRHIAKNLVAAGITNEALVQTAYAIGEKNAMNLFVDTYGKSKVFPEILESAAEKIKQENVSPEEARKIMNQAEKAVNEKIANVLEGIFDMTPYAIEQRLKLREPMYFETASGGHMGRKNEIVTKTFEDARGEKITKDVELFTWEKLDYVEKIKKAFKLS